jgi:hypothetical protein
VVHQHQNLPERILHQNLQRFGFLVRFIEWSFMK